MEKNEIVSKIKDIIKDKLHVNQEQITEQASFTNDLGADSLDTVELIMEIEHEFNLSIPDEDAAGITTVNDVIEYVEKHIK